MGKKSSYEFPCQRNIPTEDQTRFLNHLKSLGPAGLPWQEIVNTCDILTCNRQAIGMLLLESGKLKIKNGRIIHPDFKDTLYN